MPFSASFCHLSRFQDHPYDCQYQFFIHFYDWITFHFMHISHLFIRSSIDGNLSCYNLVSVNTVAMNFCVQDLEHLFSVFWGSLMVFPHSAYCRNAKPSSTELYSFTFLPGMYEHSSTSVSHPHQHLIFSVSVDPSHNCGCYLVCFCGLGLHFTAYKGVSLFRLW